MIATEADLPLIVELGAEAHAASTWAALADFDPDSFRASCIALMENDDGAVLVSETGSLWLMRFPLYFNHAETITHEVFFYARKGGDALRREGERWAGPGLGTFSRNDATDPRLDTLYRRAGYVPVEHTFASRRS